MKKNIFNYEAWISDAFVTVAKKALLTISENEFLTTNIYITFSTNHKKTLVSEDILKKYPQQITIVLENDFQNLEVKKDGFTVNLSFNGVREDIFIPFQALISFYDVTNNISLVFKQNSITKTENKNNIIKFTPKK